MSAEASSLGSGAAPGAYHLAKGVLSSTCRQVMSQSQVQASMHTSHSTWACSECRHGRLESVGNTQ